MYCIFVLAAKRVATIIITIPPTISEDIKVNIHEINIASAPDTPVFFVFSRNSSAIIPDIKNAKGFIA